MNITTFKVNHGFYSKAQLKPHLPKVKQSENLSRGQGAGFNNPILLSMTMLEQRAITQKNNRYTAKTHTKGRIDIRV